MGEEEGIVYLLDLVLYGLRGAPKAWWLTFRDALFEAGFKQCKNDPAFLLYSTDGRTVHGGVHVHVDDIIVGGDRVFEAALLRLKTKIQFGEEEAGEFIHLGLSITQDPNTFEVTFHQKPYIAAMQEVELTQARNTLTFTHSRCNRSDHNT